MDLQKENNLMQEAFEVEVDEIGFCLDQKWGDSKNPYENSDTALAFNLFKKGWQAAKAQAVPDGFVLVLKEPNLEFKGRLRSYLDNLWMGEWGCDLDGFVCVSGIDPNEIWQFMIEAQEPTND